MSVWCSAPDHTSVLGSTCVYLNYFGIINIWITYEFGLGTLGTSITLP